MVGSRGADQDIAGGAADGRRRRALGRAGSDCARWEPQHSHDGYSHDGYCRDTSYDSTTHRLSRFAFRNY
ncbi:MAG: hypothetical protein WD399_08695 [Thermoleophilaceae bacterium]